jgi:PEP-CTERM motif
MSPRKHFLSYASGVALAASMALVGFTGDAHAGAFGYTTLDISNFIASTGGSELDAGTGGNVTGVSFSDGFTTQATVGGTTASGPGTSGSTQCVSAGTTCTGLNPTVFQTPTVQNFSAASTSLSGSPILNVLGQSNTAAHATTAAQTQLTGNNIGNAGADITLTAGLTFTLVGDHQVDLSFHGMIEALAGLDPAGANSGASSKWNIVITDQTTGKIVLNWTPLGLGSLGFDATSGTTGTGFCTTLAVADGCAVVLDPFSLQQQENAVSPFVGTNDTGLFSGDFDIAANLIGGHTYGVTITHSSDDSIVSVAVPEPSSLAVLGSGLLSLGLAYRRRRA